MSTGEHNLEAWKEPFLNFKILFLTGQFEAAVNWLAHIDGLRCHALHVALALYEKQLLVIPSHFESLLCKTFHYNHILLL